MRNSFLLTTSLVLLSPTALLSTLTPTAIAQVVVVPEELKVPARFGVQHSSSSAGSDGVTGIQGFIPLGQSPGDTITFIDGRLLLDNGGHLGGNFALGYRDFNPNHNRITGGYVGLDSRTTQNSTFYQVGAGFESLGDWDIRLNGYLPVGDASNTVQDVDIDTGLQTTSGFQSNQLVLNRQQQRQRIRVIEDALGGADAEVGGRLTGWKGGDLRGYVGAYVMGGQQTDTFIGGKLRLAANITPNFNAGLAFQYDAEFGSNLAFSIGASLPGLRSPERTDLPEELPWRLRESVARNPNILVATQSESESFFENSSQVLQNPEEEQDYRFIHVTLSGGEGGDGTIESPFGSVSEAIALVNSDPTTYSDGNTVIYVDGEGTSPSTIQSFTIPQRVQVLSQGPEQFLAGLPFPGFPEEAAKLPFSDSNNYTDGIRVQLPLSGDGAFPVITGGGEDLVTAGGDRTVLAGFQLDNAGQNAFVARGVNNVELRNNRIAGAGANGIYLDDVGGSVILFDNEVNDAAGRGIFVENQTSQQAVDVVIAGYQLNGNGIGMEFSTINNPDEAPNQTVSIQPSNPTVNPSQGTVGGGLLNNSILNSLGEGLLVSMASSVAQTFGSQEITFNQGTISGSGRDGVRVTADLTAGNQEVAITNSSISQNGEAGVTIRNGTQNPFTTFTAQELFVRGNTISGNDASGIDIELNSSGSQELTIDDNTISNNQGDGIRSVAKGGLQEWPTNPAINGAGISNNRIFGNGEQGIDVEAEYTGLLGDETVIAVLDIVNNELQDNNQQSNGVGFDIDVAALSTEITACAIIDNNFVPSGIVLSTLSLDSDDQATFFVRSRDLLTSLNNNAPVQLLNQNAGSSESEAFIDVNDSCIP